MSFGLGHGRTLDESGVAIDLGPLPDTILDDPRAGWLEPGRWFPVDRPLELEIGTGKGAFMLQHAERRPDINLLGIEWAREFHLYGADRVRRRGLDNVRTLCTDATEFLKWRVPDETFTVIHLYFSDPWPKSRHHRRRVVQDAFLRDAWRVLRTGGELRIVTDHADYWAWMETHFDRWTTGTIDPDLPSPPFERLPFDRADSAGEGELVGTNFERKYRREGRPFHACLLRKREAGTGDDT